MKPLALALLVALTVASPAWAWGGLFNRFNPSLMSDMYGDSYGRQLFRAAEGGRPGSAQVLKKLCMPRNHYDIHNIFVTFTGLGRDY